MHSQMNCGCRGHDCWQRPVQHANPTWTAIGDGLIDLGDCQRCLIAKLEASRVGLAGLRAVVAFSNQHIVERRLDRKMAPVDSLVQETRVGHARAHRKQPHRQDQPGGMAQRTAINGHVGGTIRKDSSRLYLRAEDALTQIKQADAEADRS